MLNPSAEFAAPIGIPTKEAKPEIETQPVIAESKLSWWSVMNLLGKCSS